MIRQLLYHKKVISQKRLFHTVPGTVSALFCSCADYTWWGKEPPERSQDAVQTPGAMRHGWDVLSGDARHEAVKPGARQQQESVLSHWVWGTGTTTHRSTSIPREQSSNGDTGMWGCFFPMGLDLTISEHRAEHTAAIPKDWPTTLTRSQTADCSEQLRIFKNNKKRKHTEW